MCTVVLFVSANNYKQPKGPLTGEQINTMWYSHITRYCKADVHVSKWCKSLKLYYANQAKLQKAKAGPHLHNTILNILMGSCRYSMQQDNTNQLQYTS